MWLANVLADFRHAFRVLRKSPGFCAVAVLSLALAIGANTAIFTLLNAIVLRELPVPNPNQLVMFGSGNATGVTFGLPNGTPQLFSVPFYRELAASQHEVQEVSALNSMGQRVYAKFGGALEPIETRVVSGNYFHMLQIPAKLGRTLTSADDRAPGSGAVAVISDAFWKRRFARDRSVIGRTFTAGDTLFTIVGVAPTNFFGTKMGEAPDMWVPLSMQHQIFPWLDNLNDPLSQSSYLIARLKPGAAPAAAASRADTLFHRFLWESANAAVRARDDGSFARAHLKLEPAARGFSDLRPAYALPLKVLTGIAAIVLLIACANLANLLLARAASRRVEFALRLAVGAGRIRLVRQLLAESLLLAMAGGVAGAAVAMWGSQALLLMISSGPQVIPLDTAPDRSVLAFTAAVSLLTSLAFGLLPALRASQLEPNVSLAEGKGAAGGRRSLSGKLLVAGQVALSLVLLVSAGLFARTIYNLSAIEKGFAPAGLLEVEMETSFSGYSANDGRLPSVYRRLEERLKAIPGVRAAGISNLTFGPAQWFTMIVPVGGTTGRKDTGINIVSPGYFDAMGTALLAGRAFQESDSANAPKVAVVNETFARYFFPGESPLGRKFRNEGFGTVQIVGLVKDSKYVDLREEPRRMAFFALGQNPQFVGRLHIRTDRSAAQIIPEVRAAMTEVEPDFPIVSITTMEESVNRTILRERLTATLSSTFSAVALVLACVGLYGVLSYNVSRRTGEIGIRMALGGQARTMARMVLGETVLVVLAGVAAGVPVVLFAARLVANMVYGVNAVDWFTIAAAAAILLLFALTAAWLPANRAAKVDPMIALRYE